MTRMATINDLGDGKYRVNWSYSVYRKTDGHYVTGRDETAKTLAGAGAQLVNHGIASHVGTLADCEEQL